MAILRGHTAGQEAAGMESGHMHFEGLDLTHSSIGCVHPVAAGPEVDDEGFPRSPPQGALKLGTQLLYTGFGEVGAG